MTNKLALAGSLFAAILVTTCTRGAAAAAPDGPLIAPAAQSPTTTIAPSFPPKPTDDEEDAIPRPLLALAAGSATSMVSFGAGALIISRYSDHRIRNGAMLGAQTGMTLAPIFAHMIVGETKRGLFFALIPLAAEAGMATLMAFTPNLITLAPLPVQYAYASLIAASIFGAALGTLDAVRVGERKPAQRHDDSNNVNNKNNNSKNKTGQTHVSPMFGDGFAGAAIYGSL